MTQLSFGPGIMYGQRLDISGSGIGPRQFGLMQDVDVTFSYTQKELYGQQQFPAAIARGQGKVTGKAKLAQINVLLYADLFFGLAPVAGSKTVSQDESQTIPATPAYTVTVTNAAAYVGDLGVWLSATGDRFNSVTTPSATLQYSVNPATGVYTFSAADEGKVVRISYLYNLPSTGFNIPITNQTQGYTPSWSCTIFQRISPSVPGSLQNVSLPWTLQLNACVSNSLSFPTSQDNWTLNAFDFGAFADASGTIGYYNAVSQ
jgi:hypothetical protein